MEFQYIEISAEERETLDTYGIICRYGDLMILPYMKGWIEEGLKDTSEFVERLKGEAEPDAELIEYNEGCVRDLKSIKAKMDAL